MKLAERTLKLFEAKSEPDQHFEIKGKKYRLRDNLMTYELQVKRGSRYEHVAYVKSKDDAMNVILDKPRNLAKPWDKL